MKNQRGQAENCWPNCACIQSDIACLSISAAVGADYQNAVAIVGNVSLHAVYFFHLQVERRKTISIWPAYESM